MGPILCFCSEGVLNSAIAGQTGARGRGRTHVPSFYLLFLRGLE